MKSGGRISASFLPAPSPYQEVIYRFACSHSLFRYLGGLLHQAASGLTCRLTTLFASLLALGLWPLEALPYSRLYFSDHVLRVYGARYS